MSKKAFSKVFSGFTQYVIDLIKKGSKRTHVEFAGPPLRANNAVVGHVFPTNQHGGGSNDPVEGFECTLGMFVRYGISLKVFNYTNNFFLYPHWDNTLDDNAFLLSCMGQPVIGSAQENDERIGTNVTIRGIQVNGHIDFQYFHVLGDTITISIVVDTQFNDTFALTGQWSQKNHPYIWTMYDINSNSNLDVPTSCTMANINNTSRFIELKRISIPYNPTVMQSSTYAHGTGTVFTGAPPVMTEWDIGSVTNTICNPSNLVYSICVDCDIKLNYLGTDPLECNQGIFLMAGNSVNYGATPSPKLSYFSRLFFTDV